MKKIFTSISMALCLAASSFNASAQQATQLSDAQKQEIQQKVLPVVFEQIKEQAGIDILGWAQPILTADYLGSLPIFNQLQGNSGLRADATPYNVQPDSIKLSVPALMASLPSVVEMLGDEMKITFGTYSTVNVPFINNYLGNEVTVEMPGTIHVSSTKLPSVLDLQLDIQSSALSYTMDISAVALGSPEFLSYDFISLTAGLSSATPSAFDITIDVKQGLHDFLGLMGIMGLQISLPQMDYQLSANISEADANIYSFSLIGKPETEGASDINLGDATIALDYTKVIPVSYLDVTSYEEDGAVYDKYWFYNSQNNGDIVTTVNQYRYGDETKADSSLYSSTRITMSSDAVTTVNLADAQSAVQAVVNNVVSELATEGAASPFEMLIEEWRDTNLDGIFTADELVPTTNIVVDAYVDMNTASAVADIDIQSYVEGVAASVATIKATADLAGSNVIAVDVVMGETTVGSAYFTSNIAGIVTDNEDIQLANVEVTPVKDGIYVSGTTAASYRIVSMSGAIVANGTVSGDNAYISTSALAKGIYVIVVTENGESKAIKFAR